MRVCWVAAVWLAHIATVITGAPVDCFTLIQGDSNVLHKAGFDVTVGPKGSQPLICAERGEEQALLHKYNHTHPIKTSILGGKPFNIPGYHNPEALLSEFEKTASSYPDIAKLINLNEVYGTSPTIEGRDLYALKISDNVGMDEDETNVLIVSNHHARELITPEVALDTVLYLTSHYSTDPAIQFLVDTHQIYIMFTMNPDGLAYVWSNDNMWRKNRRHVSGSTYGVDLNRNYPFGWSWECGGSTTGSSQTYRGGGPGSEAEVITMMEFQKDRHFAKVLDYHSYSRDVRINYGWCATVPSVIDQMFIKDAVEQGNTMGYKQVQSCCTGGDISYAYHDHGSLSFLVETGTSFQPSQPVMEAEVVRVRSGTLFFLNLPIALQGHVHDQNGKPLGASFSVANIGWNYNEVMETNPITGRYALWIPVGTWAVTATAPNHQSQEQTVTVTEQGSIVDFYLVAL